MGKRGSVGRRTSSHGALCHQSRFPGDREGTVTDATRAEQSGAAAPWESALTCARSCRTNARHPSPRGGASRAAVSGTHPPPRASQSSVFLASHLQSLSPTVTAPSWGTGEGAVLPTVHGARGAASRLRRIPGARLSVCSGSAACLSWEVARGASPSRGLWGDTQPRPFRGSLRGVAAPEGDVTLGPAFFLL